MKTDLGIRTCRPSAPRWLRFPAKAWITVIGVIAVAIFTPEFLPVILSISAIFSLGYEFGSSNRRGGRR